MARYKVYVSADVKLDELVAKRYEALHRSGINYTDIVERALTAFLVREPADIIKDVGLVEMLERAEVIELPERYYELIPEKVKV